MVEELASNTVGNLVNEWAASMVCIRVASKVRIKVELMAG